MKEKDNKTLGEQLKEARLKMEKMTQAKLSRESGISLFAITALEQGRVTEANTYTLRQLGKVLNYTFKL